MDRQMGVKYLGPCQCWLYPKHRGAYNDTNLWFGVGGVECVGEYTMHAE